MIHEKRKECFDAGLNMGREYWKGRVQDAIHWWYIEVFAVKMSKNSQGGSSYLGGSIRLGRDLVSSLDACVTQGGLCYRVLGTGWGGENFES